MYIEAPDELEVRKVIEDFELEEDEEYVLLVVKPVYDIPGSGLHWFLTFSDHHEKALGLKKASFDPCIHYRENQNDHPIFVVLKSGWHLRSSERNVPRMRIKRNRKMFFKKRLILKELQTFKLDRSNYRINNWIYSISQGEQDQRFKTCKQHQWMCEIEG